MPWRREASGANRSDVREPHIVRAALQVLVTGEDADAGRGARAAVFRVEARVDLERHVERVIRARRAERVAATEVEAKTVGAVVLGAVTADAPEGGEADAAARPGM